MAYDTYNAPENPLLDSFAGVTNFLRVLDTLISTRASVRELRQRWALQGSGACTSVHVCHHERQRQPRRQQALQFRQTFWLNSQGLNSHGINPMQLKCDRQVAGEDLTYKLHTCLLGS